MSFILTHTDAPIMPNERNWRHKPIAKNIKEGGTSLVFRPNKFFRIFLCFCILVS
jgi:hypothetical protein